MEKWKIGVIIALIVGFGTFQWYSNGGGRTAPEAPGETQNAVEPEPTPIPEVIALAGKKPHAWNIPKNLWINTPKPIMLSDLKGSVTLIEFWRLKCKHCQESIPVMKEIYQRFKGRGLKMVTFQSPGELTAENPENRWADVQRFAMTNNIPYPVAFDEGRKLKVKYDIEWYPLILLLDREGHIRFVQTGHTPAKVQQLMKMVERMMHTKPKP